MKTQITSLINGSKNVIRDDSNEKYMNASEATSHVGYAGTNSVTRNEIAMKVADENPDKMRIAARGIDLELDRHFSCPGKTWWWNCELTEEQYVQLGGSCTDGTIKAYSMTVSMSCEVSICSFTKKSENAHWRQSKLEYLDESFITIL